MEQLTFLFTDCDDENRCNQIFLRIITSCIKKVCINCVQMLINKKKYSIASLASFCVICVLYVCVGKGGGGLRRCFITRSGCAPDSAL